MRLRGQDERWGAEAVVGVLLLGFIGCTTTLERAAPEREAATPPASSNGFLGEYPTQPPEAAAPSGAVTTAPPDATAPSGAVTEGPPEATLRVHEIALRTQGGRRVLAVRVSRHPMRVQHLVLHNPERLVLDLTGPLAPRTGMQTHPVGDGVVDRVRVGSHDGRLRIVVDLNGSAPPEDVSNDDRSVVAVLAESADDAAAERLIYRAPGIAPIAITAAASEPNEAATAVASPEDGAAAADATPPAGETTAAIGYATVEQAQPDRTRAGADDTVTVAAENVAAAADDADAADDSDVADTSDATASSSAPESAAKPAEPIVLAEASDAPGSRPAPAAADPLPPSSAAPVAGALGATDTAPRRAADDEHATMASSEIQPVATVPAETETVAAPTKIEPAAGLPPVAEPARAGRGTKAAEAAPVQLALDADHEAAPAAAVVESVRGVRNEVVDPSPDAPVADGDEAPAAAVLEKPKAYAMPVQSAGQARPKGTPKGQAKKSGAIVTPIEGGTIEQLPPRGPREYTGQRITLDFKDADIQNVLRILADVSGLNIITTEEVQGKLTMRLVDVPWDQAFDTILRAKNLDSVREGNIVRVSTVEQLKKERDALRAAEEAQKQVEPLLVRYIKINYAKADEKLVKKVQEVLTERGSATWDERTNTIVVRDIARGVADAQELISKFDTQTPQVLIEANIVEATAALIRDLGIQWGYTYKAGPETGNAPGVNFPGRITSGGVLAGGKNSPAGTVPFIADFPAANVVPGAGTAYDLLLGSIDGAINLDARLTALENENKGKIISRPRVVTLNNVPAKIESLRILRVRLPSTGTVISTGAGGVAGSSQTATEQIRTGITLQVTPQVSSDGFVFLDVFAKSSTLQQSSSPDNIPDEISREAESHVLIRNGETFVLGGVFRDDMQNTDAGIPFLRSIPVLGWAFKNNVKNRKREELLVFITPTAVQGRSDAELASLPSAQELWQNRPHP